MSNSNPNPTARSALEAYMTIANAQKSTEVAVNCAQHHALGVVGPHLKRAIAVSPAVAGVYGELTSEKPR